MATERVLEGESGHGSGPYGAPAARYRGGRRADRSHEGTV